MPPDENVCIGQEMHPLQKRKSWSKYTLAARLRIAVAICAPDGVKAHAPLPSLGTRTREAFAQLIIQVSIQVATRDL